MLKTLTWASIFNKSYSKICFKVINYDDINLCPIPSEHGVRIKRETGMVTLWIYIFIARERILVFTSRN